MPGPNGNSRAGRFFSERSGACAGFFAVLLVILLTLALLAAFPLYTVAAAFEQGGLQKTMKALLQEDEMREEISDTLRDSLPEEVISDQQINTLLSDDTILEAAGRFLYDAIQSESTTAAELVGHMLDSLDDPENASLYKQALDQVTDTLKIDDETYRKAIEKLADDQNIRLPADKSDKLALLSAVLESAYEELRKDEAASETPPLSRRDQEELAMLRSTQGFLVRMQTPHFFLYNLLTLAVVYGLILLLKRSYRKPLLHCGIPYAIAGLFMLALRFLVRPVMGLIPDDIPFVETVAQSAENALMRSMLLAFLFALPLIAAYVILTVSRRRNANYPGVDLRPEPQYAYAESEDADGETEDTDDETEDADGETEEPEEPVAP